MRIQGSGCMLWVSRRSGFASNLAILLDAKAQIGFGASVSGIRTVGMSI